QGGMGVGAPRPHFGRHPDGFHDFRIGCARARCAFGVAFDAIGALGDVGHGHGDQLLGLRVQRAGSEHGPAEGLERGQGLGCEFGAPPGQFGGGGGIRPGVGGAGLRGLGGKSMMDLRLGCGQESRGRGRAWAWACATPGRGGPTMAVFRFRVNRMESRRPMDGLASGPLLVLCLIWAMLQIALKATAPDFAPMFQIAVRSAVAGLLVILLMAVRGERLDGFLDLWRPGLLAGTLYALEFVLVGESLRHTSAGHVVVLLYTAPIFAALGLHWKLPDERLAAVQWLGV